MNCQFCTRPIADHFGIHFFKSNGRNAFSCCAYVKIPGFSEGVINTVDTIGTPNESFVDAIEG